MGIIHVRMIEHKITHKKTAYYNLHVFLYCICACMHVQNYCSAIILVSAFWQHFHMSNGCFHVCMLATAGEMRKLVRITSPQGQQWPEECRVPCQLENINKDT